MIETQRQIERFRNAKGKERFELVRKEMEKLIKEKLKEDFSWKDKESLNGLIVSLFSTIVR